MNFLTRHRAMTSEYVPVATKEQLYSSCCEKGCVLRETDHFAL